VNQKFLGNIKSDVEEAKEMLALLENHRKAIEKIRLDMISTIEKKTDETGEKLSADLENKKQ
jgi:hypothetical protein